MDRRKLILPQDNYKDIQNSAAMLGFLLLVISFFAGAVIQKLFDFPIFFV